MSAHSHYLRTIHRSPESVIEWIQDDSRQKILVRSIGSHGTVELLVDPNVWFQFRDLLLPHLPDQIPPIFLQEGPTCGLYAMKIMAPHLDPSQLLRAAQGARMTVAGEMFCAHDWATLACSVGLKATVVHAWMIPQLFRSGRRGVAAVPYDADSSGISYRRGANAHWCIVWELWNVPNECIVLLTHSSSPLAMVEKWSELEHSNRQLIQATVRVDSQHVHFLEARCLAGFAVWIDRAE